MVTSSLTSSLTNNLNYAKLNNGYADLTFSPIVDGLNTGIDWSINDRDLELTSSIMSKSKEIKEKERALADQLDAMADALSSKEKYEEMKQGWMNMDAINWYKIKDFDIINNKVMKVLFYDGKIVKVVCHEDDEFDIRRGLFLAMAKHQLKDTHTVEGIEHEATQFSYLKGYNKIVDDAIKAHDKKLKELEKQKQQEEERLRIKENKKRKHAEYLKRREEKRINAQAQAVLRGLQMYDEEQKKKKKNYADGECENTAF